MVGRVAELLNCRCGHVQVFQTRLDLIDGNRRSEFHLDQGAAGEINPITRSPVHDQADDTGEDHQKGESEGDFAFSDKIDVDVRFDKLHESVPQWGLGPVAPGFQMLMVRTLRLIKK
ncbi:hypothetical protein DESC_70045 [Desulfosarcina cetonica]|nr:hypothetical protein DESC_70045 [Desulfosarcina cetonica]